MRQKLYHVILSAFLYGIFTAFMWLILVFPDKTINLSECLPPILGILWGLPAAIGVSLSGAIVLPLLSDSINTADFTSFIGTPVVLFISAYLPHLMWDKWKNSNQENKIFFFTTETLWNFIAILLVTFLVTSILRGVFASPEDIAALKGFFGVSKNNALMSYVVVCFINDFFIALFFGLMLFFVIVNKDLKESNEQLTAEERRALKFALMGYGMFPLIFIYLDIYQIYGMDRIETWLDFITECLIIIDIYNVLMIYFMLRYRRSIMIEIVFLVTVTVFLSAAVLGAGSSVAMSNMVNSHVNDTLREMGIICRERLDRTFFCIRQAVKGMERQAIQNVESYDRLIEDVAYREEYFSTMEKDFLAIASDTDGCLAYYLRLDPEIAGSQGGFSMVRKDNRWEGALSPFVKRDPVDLSLYSPDIVDNIDWYYIPFKTRCATWIDPYIDPATLTYVISYVAPIFVDGKFLGVIGIDIDFNFIIQELRRMSIYNYGYVYLTNRNNIVLYHKDQEQGSVFHPNPEFQEMEIYLTNGMWLGIATPLSKVYDERNHILMHLIAAILIVAMIVSIASIYFVSRSIRPLKGMTDAAKRIASGDLNVQISYESGNELGILVRSIREMAAKLETYVYRDKLTGLRNAAAYMSKCSELDIKSKKSSDFVYAVIIFDVNFLKKVNDNYGHQAGNQLLRHASEVIGGVFENSPSYRVGGDEFAVILEQGDYENCEELIKIFDEKIAQECFEVSGDTIYVSVARGVGFYEQGMEFAEVVKKADTEMYRHKTAIKSKYGEDVR